MAATIFPIVICRDNYDTPPLLSAPAFPEATYDARGLDLIK
jgi:hypothetical protein